MSGKQVHAPKPGKRFGAEMALVATCGIWGATFPLIRDALNDIGPLSFVGVRFAAIALILAIAVALRPPKINRELLIAGFWLGVTACGGYTLQTFALKATQSNRVAFFTSLVVVFVPLCSALIEKRLLVFRIFVGCGVAVAGALILLNPAGGFSPYGDALAVMCMFCYTANIILLEKYSPIYNKMTLALMQAVFISLSAFLLIFAGAEDFYMVPSRRVMLALFFTAIPAGALALWLQLWGQSLTTATRASFIYIMEPVFAAIFGFVLLSELLTPIGWFGAALIVSGGLLTLYLPPLKLLSQRKGD